MYDRILVPTDGSTVAQAAAEAGIALASRFGADLHAVHVLEVGELPPGVEDADADDRAVQGREATERIVERARERGVEAGGSVIEAPESIHRAIIDYATEHDVDCIVMGTYGRTGLDRFVLGSVAEQTLRESPIPVVTVHEETALDPAFGDILVPTDGSDSAAVAADRAIDLAVETGGTLHVLHVVDLGVIWSDAGAGEILDALERSGQSAIDTVVERAEAAGVETVEASLASGSPYRSIVDYAADHDVDCIVMGTHGRTGIRRYLLGSVAERVVRLAEVPVMAVKDTSEQPVEDA